MSTIVPPPTDLQHGIALHHGDCLNILRSLADNSVDAVVTDPPYGLEFMGKGWDAPWRSETPGINADAGMSGTGYTDGGVRLPRPTFTGSTNPACLTCGKQRRGSAGPRKCACPDGGRFRNVRAIEMRAFGEWCEQWTVECLRVLKPGGHLLAFGGTRTWHRLACAVEEAGFEVRDSLAWMYGSGFPKSLNVSNAIGWDPDAKQWEGWGTALKPAFEPIVMARKPLAGTVAANVITHGTGALNINSCRIGSDSTTRVKRGGANDFPHEDDSWTPVSLTVGSDAGRWPANVIIDESQAAELDEQSGTLTSGKMLAGTRPKGERETFGQDAANGYQTARDTPGDSGGASRFFYVAKADQSERVRVGGIAHPTVKPLSIMRWLVRLVTPPGGTVLEPFAGSGTTVEACLLEGFGCVAIEREADYLPLIRQRVARRVDPVAAVAAASDDGGLFDLLDGGAA